jgi:hypothetical protein
VEWFEVVILVGGLRGAVVLHRSSGAVGKTSASSARADLREHPEHREHREHAGTFWNILELLEPMFSNILEHSRILSTPQEPMFSNIREHSRTSRISVSKTV